MEEQHAHGGAVGYSENLLKSVFVSSDSAYSGRGIWKRFVVGGFNQKSKNTKS
jgi:hypothetical protein